jgi:ATP-binding protein involved in chromosome partitioning
MTYTTEEIRSALSHVNDPDLKKDLVTLNMIQDIASTDDSISFNLVLTTPACPLQEMIKKDCIAAIHQYIDSDVQVDIEVTSMVTTTRAQEESLKGVKNIIAVASGKGGVGKSTVSLNLALALAQTGASVGLMDADVYGPSIPTMMGIDQKPGVKEIDGEKKLVPVEKYGIKAISMGMLMDEDQAVVWRGPMVSGAIKQFINDCDWGELDYLVIDMPPGTGDIHLTLVQTLPVTGALLVTTPQKVALADARKAAAMFRMGKIAVPVLGVVENMAWFTPAELPDNKYPIFGAGGGEQLATELGSAVLAQIPLVQAIREGGDTGKPVVEGGSVTFEELAQKVAQAVAIRNASLEPTKVVSIL